MDSGDGADTEVGPMTDEETCGRRRLAPGRYGGVWTDRGRHATFLAGTGSRAAALAMVFKLVEPAQARRRAVNAPHLVALVRNGARFGNGHLIELPEPAAA